MRSKYLLTFAGISGAIAVMLGAFAAHGLKAILPEYLLGVCSRRVFSTSLSIRSRYWRVALCYR